ncbi:MAG: hypothetical protein AB9Q22_10450 [Candidatus Reddybacter sp.]
MKWLVFILLCLLTSWHYTDLSAESAWQNMLAPIGVFIFLISLCLWLVVKAGFGSKASRGGGFFGGDGGGDGGC